jgi:glycosyltransferase involved in cell wall biosynthesis
MAIGFLFLQIIIIIKTFQIKKIKVLHIAQAVGGVEICLRQISKNIDVSAFNNVIICQHLKDKPKFLDKFGNEIKTYHTSLVRNISPIDDIRSFFATIFILIKERPAIIHAHSAKGGAIGRLASIFFDIPVIYTPHAFSYLSTNNKFKKRAFLFLERILKFKNVNVLATSKSEQDRAVNEVGYDRKQTQVLENAIDSIKTYSNNSTKILHEDYISSIGRPSYQKNTKMLIDVFEVISKKHIHLHLYIVGAGEYSPELNKIKTQINSKKLNDRITIIPWVSRKEAMTILKFSKLYVSTSIYEGMPYAVIEGLYLHKAMVLTNCDGNKDLIQDNFSGFLVKSKKEMIKKISFLLNDDTKRKQLEANAHKEYLKRHQIEIYVEKLTKIYNNITK